MKKSKKSTKKKTKNNTKNNFDKFSSRQKCKRRGKEAAKRELMRAVRESEVGISSLHVYDRYDGGRRARISNKKRRDEMRAVGVFSSAKGGFGFVSVDGYDKDIFISEDSTLGAIDADTVEIIYHLFENRDGEQKSEGRVTKIVRAERKTLIGTVEQRRVYHRSHTRAVSELVLIPDERRIPFSFRITDLGGAHVGDKVECRIIRSQNGGTHACEVIRVFGDSESREANYKAILADCEIPTDFTKEELAEAEFFASMPITCDGRVKRKEIIFTIDGEDAKDLDDAISLRRIKGGWQLGVHIADVSYYVRERTKLDRAVMARGTSVYFTDKVVPMLPQSLSNGACSLNCGEDKYALSAIVNLDEYGEIIKCKIEKSVIKSRVRGVYSEVNRIFDGTADAALRKKYAEVTPTLFKMRELYEILLKKARTRGGLELESSEAKIVLDESGMPVDIIRRERADAEKLIEQFMVCANEGVARLLSERGIPCVYRIHDNPPPEKLADFVAYAANLGLDTRGISRDNASAKDYSQLLKDASDNGVGTQISYAMLRSMSKAKYLEKRKGHFGLSLDYYCHFTSPIRRLSDLGTHRIIHKVMFEGRRPELYAKYAARVARAATDTEIRAVGAERRIENLYKVIYMQDKVGEEFNATINSVTSFGFFAELENTCEGLVPIGELGGTFIYDEKHRKLRSRREVYSIADRVRVRVEEADIISGKLRFSVVEKL